MKKLLNVLLILAVVITNLFPANVLAAGKTLVYGTDKGSITINKAVENETYSIYKLFDVLFFDEDQNIATYALNEDFTDTALINKYFDTTESIVNNTTKETRTIITGTKEGFTGSVVAEFAKEALASIGEENMTNSVVATSTTVEFNNLALGYYLVDSSVGTLCHIDTTTPNATIEEKNTSTPYDTKSIVEGQSRVNTSTAKIGDTIEYEIKVGGIDNRSNVVVKDIMEDSLTFNKDVKVYVETTELTSGVTITYNVDGNDNSFTVKFADDFLKGNTSEFVIKYSAVLNENAIAEEANENEFKVTYGNNQTIDGTNSVTTYTYEMTLEKVDENGEDLTGAIFQLSQVTSKGLKLLNVVPTDEGYRLANGNEAGMTTSIVAGTVTILGLENGTYSLEEISAPEGYNKLAKPVEFTIEDANYDGSFQVVNTTGMILPSTGGMGTVLFITVGSIMALGFGVNLVTKARMRKIED